MVLFGRTRNAVPDPGVRQFSAHTPIVSGRTGMLRGESPCAGSVMLVERIGIRETRSLFLLDLDSLMDQALNADPC